MKYLCLVYVEETTLHAMPQSERVALSDQSMAYCDELQKNGQLIGASPLHPVETATTVRVRGGKVSTIDGPFAETKEQLGGYLLIDVRDMNDAVRIASKFPAAQYGSIEVRPLKENGCASPALGACENFTEEKTRMRKLVVGAFLTLDGVMQAPGGPDEDRDGGFQHGGWLVPYFDEKFVEIMTEWTKRAGAFLLGRKTYEMFAASWPKSTDPADESATALNTRPKFVASRTLDAVNWNNSHLLKGDVAEEIAKLKAQEGGEIQVHGSSDLLQTLLKYNLVDTFRIWQFPVLIGTGKRLFGEGTIPGSFRLVETQQIETGAVLHVYERAGGLTYGEVEVGQETVIFDSGAVHT